MIPSGFSTEIFYAFLIYLTRATCPVNNTRDVITVIVFAEASIVCNRG